MQQATQRAGVRGPTFIRLLARLTEADVRASKQSLSERLGQWLDWTHAVALSTALDGKPPEVDIAAPGFGSAESDECARVRRSLIGTIVGDAIFATSPRRESEHALAGETRGGEAIDYAAFRQRYLAIQRSIQAATGKLRGRLRDVLAQTSNDMARLAEVDAVMERVLSPREQALLARVPALLGERFERLREAGQKVADAPLTPQAPATPDPWLDVFRRDMQSVLLAELDVRFYPVEGLLTALRTPSLSCHDQKSA